MDTRGQNDDGSVLVGCIFAALITSPIYLLLWLYLGR